MSTRFITATMAFALVMSLSAAPGSAQPAPCGAINGDTNLSNDYVYTDNLGTSAPCLTITGTGVDLDCKGHSIICNNPAGCGTAIDVQQDGAKITDCRIVSGTGDWAFGVIGRADTDMTKNYVVNASYGLVRGDTIKQNVVIDAKLVGITSGFAIYAAGTEVIDNYCTSLTDGMLIIGPTSGTPAKVAENYVRAADQGMIQAAGKVDFEKNIIDSTYDWTLASPSDVSQTKNLCDEAGCVDPTDTPFGLTLTIN